MGEERKISKNLNFFGNWVLFLLRPILCLSWGRLMKSNLFKKYQKCKCGHPGWWVGAGATIKIYSSWATELFSSCVVTFLSISSAHALSSPGCNLSWNWIFLSTFKAHLLGCFLRHFSCKEKRLTKSIQTSTSVFFCLAFFFRPTIKFVAEECDYSN